MPGKWWKMATYIVRKSNLIPGDLVRIGLNKYGLLSVILVIIEALSYASGVTG